MILYELHIMLNIFYLTLFNFILNIEIIKTIKAHSNRKRADQMSVIYYNTTRSLATAFWVQVGLCLIAP